MGDKGSQYFDLTILFSFGNINLLTVLRNNLKLRVGDYFSLLSVFEHNAHKRVDAMDRVVALGADENDVKTMMDTMDLLEDIGCTKLLPGFSEIIKASKMGHAAYASDCAKKISDDFTRFCSQVGASKKTKKPEAAGGITEGDNAPETDFETLLLKDALVQLEKAEATRMLRVLAVDDSPVMLNTITSILNENYKVYGMAKPLLVEKFLSQITPDLFLLDYEMPELNGFELIPIIRNFEEHKDTPIIFLTSMGTTEFVSSAASLGACDFIVKPFQPDNLSGKVAKHTTRKKLSF